MRDRESKPTAVPLSHFLSFSLSLLLILFLPGVLHAQVEEPPPGSEVGEAVSDSANVVTPGGALFRSAILPGWGQIYTGHKIKQLKPEGVVAQDKEGNEITISCDTIVLANMAPNEELRAKKDKIYDKGSVYTVGDALVTRMRWATPGRRSTPGSRRGCRAIRTAGRPKSRTCD